MAKISLEHLDAEHLQPFRQALWNVLSTPVAESTYAQIIDGMPLSTVYKEHHWYFENFSVESHHVLCPGSLDKALSFRSSFDLTSLQFEAKTVQSYQNTAPGSVVWKLRLLELLAIAIHDIAATLWSLDDGAHKHAELEAWLTSRLESGSLDEYEQQNLPPSTWFWHYDYDEHKQYPKGVADVVGYWAEVRIFGGVVLFDRGESDEECNGVYLHNTTRMCGYTIAPPTEDQFDALLGFLLSPNPDTTLSPLPITITDANKWRWDPYQAMATYHIFRDRHERKLPPQHLYRRKDVLKPRDWPEVADISTLRREVFRGTPVPEAEEAAAKKRLMQITPSSPYWSRYGEEICRLQPVKKMQGRPPYFFDT